MTNGISESLLYVGLYLMEEGAGAPVTAALLKLERSSLQESDHFAYGLAYLERPGALALNPLHLPLLREGGALPLTIKDALPDAWGLRVLARTGRAPAGRARTTVADQRRPRRRHGVFRIP